MAYRLIGYIHSLGVLFHRVEQNFLREFPYYDTISRGTDTQGIQDPVTLAKG